MTDNTYASATKYDVRQADLGKPYRVCLVDDDGSTYFDSWWATIDEAIAQTEVHRSSLIPKWHYRIAIFHCIPTA
jgi:hypothetical protein